MRSERPARRAPRVAVEAHLAREVGEDPLYHEPARDERTLVALVGGAALQGGCQQVRAGACEPGAVGSTPEALSATSTAAGVPVSRSATGSYCLSFAATSGKPSCSPRRSATSTSRTP